MAKNYLSGITLNIGGDTTDLSKALQQPNKEAQDLQSKLSAINQALKLDPGNTDLLAQKQRILGEAIEANEKRLDLLKEAQEQFIASGKDVDSREYIELERQIAKTESQVKKLKTEQKDMASGTDVFRERLDKLSTSADNFANKTAGISKAAGGLIAAFAGSVALTDELRQDLSFLDQNAENAGVSVDRARDAFDTFNNVVNETDSSVEGVSNLLQAGFTESNLQKAVEALTGAYIRFPDTMKIESLADSLQETLATGEATGQFAELLDRLGIGAESFSEELSKCTTSAEKQNYALKVLADAGLNDTYDEYKRNNKELLESRQATQDFQESLADLAEVALPVVTDITEAVTGLVKWFTQLPPAAQTTIGALTGIVAIASPTAKAVSSVSDVIGKMTEGTGLAKKATELFGTASSVLGGHLGLVAVGAAALVGGVAALTYALTDGGDPLYKYAQAIDDARASLDEMEIAKQEIISQAEAEAQTYQSMYDQLESLVDANGRVRDGYEAQAEALANELNSAIGTNIQLVDGQIQGMQEAGEEMDVYIEKMRAQAVIEAQAEQMKQLQELYNQNVENLADMNASIEQKQAEHNARVEELRKQGLSEQEIAQDNLVMLYQSELDTYSSQKDEILTLMSETEGQMQTYYTNLGLMRKGDLESLKQINASEIAEIDENGNLILETQKRKSDELQAQIEAAQYRMTQTTDEAERARLQSTIDSLEEQKQAQVDGIQSQAAAVASGAYSIAKEWKLLANKSLVAVKRYDGEFYSAGKDSALGYANGISAYASVAVGAVNGLSSMVVSALKKSLDIHSPSRLMEDLIGKNIVLGIADGIEENENAVLDPLNALAKKMTSFNLSPDFSGQINKSLHLDNSVTVTSPIQIDLDGKPIYQNVVTRITRTQGMRSQFKGGYG